MKFLVLDEADDLQKKDDRKEHSFFVHFPGPFLGVFPFLLFWSWIWSWLRLVSCVLIQIYVGSDETASTAHLTPFIKSSKFIQSSYQPSCYEVIYPPVNSHSHGKSPYFLVHTIKTVDFPASYVSLQECNLFIMNRESCLRL